MGVAAERTAKIKTKIYMKRCESSEARTLDESPMWIKFPGPWEALA